MEDPNKKTESNVIEFPRNKEVVITEANFHTQPYTSKGQLQVGMNTHVLSDMVTVHNMKIGALRSNQYVEVNNVDVQGNVSVLDIELFEKELN